MITNIWYSEKINAINNIITLITVSSFLILHGRTTTLQTQLYKIKINKGRTTKPQKSQSSHSIVYELEKRPWNVLNCSTLFVSVSVCFRSSPESNRTGVWATRVRDAFLFSQHTPPHAHGAHTRIDVSPLKGSSQESLLIMERSIVPSWVFKGLWHLIWGRSGIW